LGEYRVIAVREWSNYMNLKKFLYSFPTLSYTDWRSILPDEDHSISRSRMIKAHQMNAIHAKISKFSYRSWNEIIRHEISKLNTNTPNSKTHTYSSQTHSPHHKHTLIQLRGLCPKTQHSHSHRPSLKKNSEYPDSIVSGFPFPIVFWVVCWEITKWSEELVVD
jgi:hypothetical protein